MSSGATQTEIHKFAGTARHKIETITGDQLLRMLQIKMQQRNLVSSFNKVYERRKSTCFSEICRFSFACDMIFARWRKPWRLTSLCQIKKISWFPLEFFKVRWCCGIGFIFPSCCTERKVCLIAVDVLSGDEYLSSYTHFSFVSTFLRVILPPWRVPPRCDIPLLRMWRGAGLQEGDFSSEIAALWACQDCNEE